jgi:hypothetical protein
VGCQRDRAGNRELHYDQYCLLERIKWDGNHFGTVPSLRRRRHRLPSPLMRPQK